MFQSIHEALKVWHKNNDDRAKLQHAVAVAALALIVVAGILSLVNANMGQQVLFGVFLLAAVWAANAVIWALLQTFVLLPLSRTRVARKRKQ